MSKKVWLILVSILFTIALTSCASKPATTNANYGKSTSDSNNVSNKNDSVNSNSNVQQNQDNQAPSSDTVVQMPEDNVVYMNKPISKITIDRLTYSTSLYGYSFKDGVFKAYVELKNETSEPFELSNINIIQGAVTTVDGQVVNLKQPFNWQAQYKIYGVPAGTSHIHMLEAKGLTNTPEKVEFFDNQLTFIDDSATFTLKGEEKNYPGVILPATVSPNLDMSKAFNQLVQNEQASVNIGNFKDIDSAIIQKISYTPNGGEIQLVLKSSRYSAYPFTIDATSDQPSYLRFELITDQNEGIELSPEVSSDALAKIQTANQLKPNEQCMLTLHLTTNLTKPAATRKIRMYYDNDVNHGRDWIKSESEYFKLK